ncbi:hypothetical protein H4W79_000015 [Nocardiopsis terrae]|uniref:Uncharacterized protein n=1 Tax=Nocardiopsis terrae TaxID=372655 RepID=A0ABR9HA92_9ACTN|nr:hypothetical protein [Nocardiopsis terrae]
MPHGAAGRTGGPARVSGEALRSGGVGPLAGAAGEAPETGAVRVGRERLITSKTCSKSCSPHA